MNDEPIEFRNAVDGRTVRLRVDGGELRIEHDRGTVTDIRLADVVRVQATHSVPTEYNPRRYRLELDTADGARFPFVLEEGDDREAFLRNAVGYVRLFGVVHECVPEANPKVQFWTGERKGWWVWLIIVLFVLLFGALWAGSLYGFVQGRNRLAAVGFLVGVPLVAWYFIKVLWVMAMPQRYEPTAIPAFLLPSV